MHHLRHTVTINAPIADVWQILLDVESWVRLFPSTTAARVTESSPTHQIVAITTEVAGTSQSWVSRRDIDEPGRVIGYRQVETAPMVARMAGQWHARAASETTTELTLTHDFEPATPVVGALPGVSVTEDPGSVLDPALELLASAQLAAIRAEAERAHVGGEARVS